MRATWQNAGSATGLVRCRLHIPALDLDLNPRISSGRPLAAVRRFIASHLPTASSALIGASFSIRAEIRAKGGGARWRVLSRWQFGESVDDALDRATSEWRQLPKEHKAR